MRAALLFAVVLGGCADTDANGDDGVDDSSSSSTAGDEPRGPADLVDPSTWVAEIGADPMPSHRPDDAECMLGYGEEFGVFEVDTELCSYGVFTQPMLAEVRAGDRVELTITHDDLVADGPAIGHIMIGLGDAHMFEAEVEIPHAYGLVTAEWDADVDVPAATPVVLHLHNHGYNQWRLVAIIARPPV